MNAFDKGLLAISVPVFVFLLFCTALMLHNQITYGYYAYITLPELFGF